MFDADHIAFFAAIFLFVGGIAVLSGIWVLLIDRNGVGHDDGPEWPW